VLCCYQISTHPELCWDYMPWVAKQQQQQWAQEGLVMDNRIPGGPAVFAMVCCTY
jgi:hypothetical protein